MSYVPPNNELASCHGRLFRYRPACGDGEFDRIVNMIKSRSLWFWHLTGQNDKRECTPTVYFGGGIQKRYEYFLKDFISEWPNADRVKIEKAARKAAKKPRVPDSKTIYQHWAVCCFSADGNSSRMWNEYACNGNGVMIECLADQTVSLGKAGKVKYTDTPVLLDILNMNERKMYEIFTTKSCEWAYEKEYRIVERLDKAKSGKNIVYGDAKILSVTTGAKMSKEHRVAIQRICAELDIKVSAQQVDAPEPRTNA